MAYVIAEWAAFTNDNAWFFADPLPGRDEPVTCPGGSKIGRCLDTERSPPNRR